jgi:hypothetical protein
LPNLLSENVNEPVVPELIDPEVYLAFAVFTGNWIESSSPELCKAATPVIREG